MKFYNKTNTIVLLYDNEKMHASINPNCVSIEIDDKVASNSPTIQIFLSKGLIKVFDPKTDRIPQQAAAKMTSSFVAHTPVDTIDTEVKTGSLPTKTDIPVQKPSGIVTPDIDSIDRVANLDSGEFITKSKTDPIGGKAVNIVDHINKEVKASVKKTQEELNAIAEKRAIAKAAKLKLENAPVEIKQFIAKKFMEKKWAILKSTDVKFIETVAEYDPSVKAIAIQRLAELKK